MLKLVDKRVFDTVWPAHKRDGGALRRLLSESRELGEYQDLENLTTETEKFCTPDRLLGKGAFNKTYKINNDIIVQKTYNKKDLSRSLYKITKLNEFNGKMYNLELYNCLCDKTRMADLTEMGSGVIPILAIWDDGHEVYTIAEKCHTELMTAYIEIYNSENLPLNETDLEKMGIIIFQKMLRTLRCLHQNEVFHLDIKTDNILLKKDVMPLINRKKEYLKKHQKCQPLTKEELDTLTNVRLIDFGLSCRYLDEEDKAKSDVYSCQKLIDNNKGLEGSDVMRFPGTKAYRYPQLTTSKEDLMLADYWSLVVSLIVFLLGLIAFNPYDDTQHLPWNSNAYLFYTMIENNSLKDDNSLDWNPYEKKRALNLMVCLKDIINPVEIYGKKIEIVLELFQDIVFFADFRKSTLRKLDTYLKGLTRSYSGRKLKKGLSKNARDIQKDVHIYHKIIKGTPSSLYQLAKSKSLDMHDSKDKGRKSKGKGKVSSSGEYYLARSREVLLIPATKKSKAFYSETNLNRSKKTIKKKKSV